MRSPNVAEKNETSLTNLLDVYSGIFEAFTVGRLEHEAGWGLWRPDMQSLSCRRFQRATIAILQMHQSIIFSATSKLIVLNIERTQRFKVLPCAYTRQRQLHPKGKNLPRPIGGIGIQIVIVSSTAAEGCGFPSMIKRKEMTKHRCMAK